MDKDFYLKADDFFLRNCPNGLTFDDLSLATRYSEVLPSNVNLETELSDSIKLSVPILSSDMDTVTESNMAIAMALMWRNRAYSLQHATPCTSETNRQG